MGLDLPLENECPFLHRQLAFNGDRKLTKPLYHVSIVRVWIM
jgi:hypothetical protein